MHQACQDPPFRRLLLEYLTEEGTPTLPAVPGIDLPRYVADVAGRFGSPAVRDSLDRIRADASDRIPEFLLPVLRADLAGGGQVRRAVAVLAGWARCLEGTDDAGRPLDVVDGRRDRLLAAARRQRTDPLALLRDRELFGDLAGDRRVAEPYWATLAALRENGARATVAVLARG